MAIGLFEIILIIVIVGLLIFVIYRMMFAGKLKNFKVRVRMLTGSKQVCVDTKGIEKKDAKGVSKLFIKKFKEFIPMPPDDCIDINSRGTFCVEAYRDRFGNYAYVEDKGVNSFRHPINTNQQIILANQIIKAHEKKTDWKQFLPMYVGIGMVVVVFIVLLLFIGEPLTKISAFTTNALEPIAEIKRLDLLIIEQLNIMKNDLQIIRGNLAIPNNPIAPN